MHTQMNHDRLKRKYLRRAQQLLHNKSRKPPKWKLQASVEPFIHTNSDPPQFERSASDPTTPLGSSHCNSRTDPRAIYQHPEWTQATACSATDTCSESDTQSVHSPGLPGKGSGGYGVPFAAGDPSHSHSMRHELDPSVRCHPVHTRRPNPHLQDDIPTSTGMSPSRLLVPPNDRSYKHFSTNSESGQSFDALLYHPQDGPVASEVYPLSSTPVASSRYRRVGMRENDCTLLAERCSELDSKLKVQMKVNQELKRLLVASVGGDLQLRLEQVVQEKANLSHDLETSLQQLAENGEEMDQVAIECDIWRSKFLASRLMIDELASWKAELSLQYKESQRALQCLLKEHEELKNILAKCNDILREIAEVLSQGSGTSGQEISLRMLEQQFHSSHSTVLDLAKMSSHYTNIIQDKLQSLGGHLATSKMSTSHSQSSKHGGASCHSVTVEPTVGEKLAKQVLVSRQQFQKSQNRSFPLPLQLDSDTLLYQRGVSNRGLSPLAASTLLFGQSDSDILFCCKHCKGKVINV